MSASRLYADFASLLLAMAVIGAAPLSSPAMATPTINFAIQLNQFSQPTMEYNYQGSGYVWDQKSITTQFDASANTNDNALVWIGQLYIQALGVGGNPFFNGTVPEDVKTWSQQGPITFPVSFLSAYQAGFASFCNINGGTEPVVKHGFSIMFSVRQAFKDKNAPPEEVDIYNPSVPSSDYAHRTVSMPMIIVCGPKPARAIPRPGGMVSEQGQMKVQSIALSFGGAPNTQPNLATICKQAKLTVTLNASKAGPVKFRLNKKVGAQPLQVKVIDAMAAFDGSAHYVASYNEYVSVNQTTSVQAMAEELINPIGLTTPWKMVTLHCTGAGGGGLAGTPNTSNPDNRLPSTPPMGMEILRRLIPGPQPEQPARQPSTAPSRR